MKRCLQLASKGKGTVTPNPLVGSVIVHDQVIIGEGFHHHAGGSHAEVMAINSVKDKSLLPNSTIYVTLEPCSHFGKTPPCANLILEHKIPKVVISCQDPFVEVAGKGIALLRKNGVEVVENILAEEGLWMNRRFFTFHKMQRPYIILKWAESKDGFMDVNRENNEKGIHWITQPKTKMLSHKWRTEEGAVLIGKNTAITDNPSLTARKYYGESPVRLLIDKNRDAPKSLKLFTDNGEIYVFTDGLGGGVKDSDNEIVVSKNNFIDSVLSFLYSKNIQSLIVEGGAFTINQFIQNNLWDEARLLRGDVLLNQGLKSPKIEGELKEKYNFGKDEVSILIPNK